MTDAPDEPRFTRTIEELAAKAVRHWPQDLLDAESGLSVLPRLLETQDKFISVLTLADATPTTWKQLVDVSPEMPANLFLKHLMVLTNVGGEALQKITPFSESFTDGILRYLWRGREYQYEFKHFVSGRRASNARLRMEAKHLKTAANLSDAAEDVVMFLLFAATSESDALPTSEKEKCDVGSLLGDAEKLDKFVRQNYIRISRQIAGATNNTLGQLVQDAVVETLKKRLPGWTVQKNGKITGVSVNDGRTQAAFDVVVTASNGKRAGIEVSFQFTGNSVIERKARDAQGLQERMHERGHAICYVVDGAGNIDIRRSAVSTICRFSDCTVAFSEAEITFLSQFLEAWSNEA
jgi:hypothetical protein